MFSWISDLESDLLHVSPITVRLQMTDSVLGKIEVAVASILFPTAVAIVTIDDVHVADAWRRRWAVVATVARRLGVAVGRGHYYMVAAAVMSLCDMIVDSANLEAVTSLALIGTSDLVEE